ncbi:MAG: NAD(P)/FAD-dependent oxidoreductase [Verrucomicrobia bacterium]|nr:NAD(P)/FAD-dependent oxidoreductase [Verrucomicrobiota bacterium]
MSAASKVYDCVIIGSGPAGLSAGIYLARALRSVLIIEAGRGGRTTWNSLNENYFGFPKGIRAAELARRGRQQAARFGVEFCTSTLVENIAQVAVPAPGDERAPFAIDLRPLDGKAAKSLRARALIFATGVTDVLPPFPHAERYVGKSFFWCLHCDGWLVRGKRLGVVGNGDDAAAMALQLLDFTPQVSLLCLEKECRVSPEKQTELQAHGIGIFMERIIAARGRAGRFTALQLEDGRELPIDYLFSALGETPNSQLAARLGVGLDAKGFIQVNVEQETNLPGVFAAGDVTSLPGQQVVNAVHQGAMAAINATCFLRPAAQKTAE